MEVENKNKTTDTDNKNFIILGSGNLITALFNNPKTVGSIYDDLLTRGYKQADVTLIMSEDTRNTCFPDNNATTSVTDLGNKSLEGVGIGAMVGGAAGALAAAIAALGTTLAIPGLGIVVAGSLAASLAGAGAGAATGGLAGALIGLGVPDGQAKMLEEGLKKGGIAIGVKAKSDEERQELHKQWLKLQSNETLFTTA